MRRVFADTGYWIALTNPRDPLNEKATIISKSLSAVRIYTSEMVLAELLNGMSKYGAVIRERTLAIVEAVSANANVEVVPQTSKLFHDALTLYRTRNDKEWGLTDCASLTIMQEIGIQEALAHDKHFVQAGYQALLRDS